MSIASLSFLMKVNGYLSEVGRHAHAEYKGGNKELAENFQNEVRKEQEWVSMLMGKKLQERKAK